MSTGTTADGGMTALSLELDFSAELLESVDSNHRQKTEQAIVKPRCASTTISM